MWGAIVGDVVGSEFEFAKPRVKRKDMPLFGPLCCFTDDTVCTTAVARWLMDGGELSDILADLCLFHMSRGYGKRFKEWLLSTPPRTSYQSWGNGAAMRVSPCALFGEDGAQVLALAEKSCLPTHDHPDAIKGAQCIAVATRCAMTGAGKTSIEYIAKEYGYDLSRSLDEIRPGHKFDVSCAGTVPLAILCCLEADCFEDVMRNAISLGGDSDTIAACAGSIAEGLFGIPRWMYEKTRSVIGPEDRILETVDRFCEHPSVSRFGYPRLTEHLPKGPVSQHPIGPLPLHQLNLN